MANKTQSAENRRSEKRQRQALVALRLHPQELEELRAAARARKVSVSEILRSAALESIRQPKPAH